MEDDSIAPLPIALETSIADNPFICKNEMPLYIFHCEVYGNSLLWEINDEEDIVFLPFDEVGRTVVNQLISYNGSSPVYNVSAVLTHISKMSLENVTIPQCVSILTVQSFNASQFEVLPFNVSCQSSCQDENHTQICQTKHYEVAGTLCFSEFYYL